MLDKRLLASIGILLFVAAFFFLYGHGSPIAYALVLIPVALVGVALFTMCDHTVVFLLGILLLGNLSYSQKIPDAIPMLLAFLSAGCGWTALWNTQRYKNWKLLLFCGAGLAIWLEALVLSGNPFDSMILMHHVCALLFVIFVATCEAVTLPKMLLVSKLYLAFLCIWGTCELILFPKDRIEGPFFSATAFGETLAVFFAILVCSSVFQKKQMNVFNVIIGIVALFNILMTGTRFALIAVIAVLGLLVPLHPQMSKKKKVVFQVLAVGVIAALASATWILLPDTLKVKQTFSALDVSHKQIDGSSLGRLLAWWVVFKTFPEHPWMGVGIGQFPELFWKHLPIMHLAHAHNIFINTIAEIGVIGLVLLLLMITALVISTFTKVNKRESAIYWCIGIVVLLLGQSDNAPLYPTMVFWAAMLCGVALRRDCDDPLDA